MTLAFFKKSGFFSSVKTRNVPYATAGGIKENYTVHECGKNQKSIREKYLFDTSGLVQIPHRGKIDA